VEKQTVRQTQALGVMKIVAVFLLVLSGSVSLGQEISGIGVALGKDGGDFVVKGVIPDSAASASKAIHPGDRIVAIAQGTNPPVRIADLPLADVVRLIRGPKGTVVRVTVVPSEKEDSEAREIRLVRGELKGVNDGEEMAFDGLQLSFWFMRLGIALAHP
jgi:predicted metalloprotease with PDZ domain